MDFDIVGFLSPDEKWIVFVDHFLSEIIQRVTRSSSVYFKQADVTMCLTSSMKAKQTHACYTEKQVRLQMMQFNKDFQLVSWRNIVKLAF